MNVEEGWCRDVSDVMADKVREVAQRVELTDGTLAFVGSRAAGKAGDATVVVTVVRNRPAPDRAPTTAVRGNLLATCELKER